MPNFIAKKAHVGSLPREKNGVKFKQIFIGRVCDLILCECEESEFFITLKPKNNSFVIKGEKLTRPAKIGLLQRALHEFKSEFCDEIISEAFAISQNSLIKKETPIKSESEILTFVNEILQAKFDEISNANPNAKFRCVRLEIGFGSGRHILYQANNNPDVFFIGIEIYKPAIEQVAKLAIAQNLNNIALLNCDARTFLQMLGSNSLDKIYLHFPVPWDDAPHRRVISYEFLQECERALRKGGIFELRSDSKNYVKFALEKMMDFPRARVNIVKNEDLNITSKYEERWKRQQKDIYEVKFECVDDKAQEKLEFDFSFGRYDATKIAQNFCNETLKFDDFFVHFEDIFYARNLDENGETTNNSSNFKENEIFIKVSFGSFNAPTSHFILITDEICKYYFKSPLKTKANAKAHEKIKEYLAK
jgi:tRNA (guanine-N(7)-)-methyltransferase